MIEAQKMQDDYIKRNIRGFIKYCLATQDLAIDESNLEMLTPSKVQRVCGIGYNQAMKTIEFGVKIGAFTQGADFYFSLCNDFDLQTLEETQS
jgi:hypothetical protein